MSEWQTFGRMFEVFMFVLALMLIVHAVRVMEKYHLFDNPNVKLSKLFPELHSIEEET